MTTRDGRERRKNFGSSLKEKEVKEILSESRSKKIQRTLFPVSLDNKCRKTR
jgi:hypothetical protein